MGGGGGGVGGSQRPKNLSKCMKLDQNFQRDGGGGGGGGGKNPRGGGGGGGVLAKTPSVEAVGVWKIFGTTQSSFLRIGHVPCK